MPETPIVIAGPRGRMGQALLRLGAVDAALKVIGVIDKPGASCTAGVAFPQVQSLRELNPPPGTVLIDFSKPEATLQHMREAAELGMNAVVGTTGFSTEQRQQLEVFSERIGLIIAANTSLGVSVLLGIVEELARTLPTYDIELVEIHHRLKKDSPSGTAEALAGAAARGRGVELGSVARHGREGLTGERPSGEIGIHSLRGGDVVGEHTMTFAGPGERIEIVHRAHSRDTFAAGALQAAKWLGSKAAGLYTMRHVLGLA